MNHLSRIEDMIPAITAGLVLIIAICAFSLSFYNLQLQALEAGIHPLLSFLWPVCLDALLIAGSLMILRSSLRDERALVGWSVLIAFTIISTGFNVIHSPADIISRCAHAIAPISLCVSVELLMICIKSSIKQPDNALVTEKVTSVTKRGRGSNAAQRIQEHYKRYPDMSTRDRAEALGLHRSTIDRHLKNAACIGAVIYDR